MQAVDRPGARPPPESRGRERQRLRTRTRILAAAMPLIAAGGRPTVTEAADAAQVSRRTAYRYFPCQEKLLAEAALEALRPAIDAALAVAPHGDSPDEVEGRVRALVHAVHRLTIENEQHLRTMIAVTVRETPGGVPRRGTRRLDWIESALAPLRGQVGRAAYRRLVSAMALCVGIESLLVLRDIRGLAPAEALRVSEWMAVALLRATLASVPGDRPPPRGSGPRGSRRRMPGRNRGPTRA